jgi:hypothetical protein
LGFVGRIDAGSQRLRVVYVPWGRYAEATREWLNEPRVFGFATALPPQAPQLTPSLVEARSGFVRQALTGGGSFPSLPGGLSCQGGGPDR